MQHIRRFISPTTQNEGRDVHHKSVSKAGNGGVPLITSSLLFSRHHFQALECGSEHSLPLIVLLSYFIIYILHLACLSLEPSAPPYGVELDR
jgi:hypothetical protein